MSRFLLDTTVLIDNLRGDEETADLLLGLLGKGHWLCVSCVNVAEIERGVRPHEYRKARSFLDRLMFLETTREAANRAGGYIRELRSTGKTLSLADAIVAGTARAHGAFLVTDNVKDFPLRDLEVVRLRALGE